MNTLQLYVFEIQQYLENYLYQDYHGFISSIPIEPSIPSLTVVSHKVHQRTTG